MEDLLELLCDFKYYLEISFWFSFSVALEYFPDNRMPYVDFGEGVLEMREQTLIYTRPAVKMEGVMMISYKNEY